MVDCLADRTAPETDANLSETVNAGVSVDPDDEILAPCIILDGEVANLCDFHLGAPFEAHV
jgi:hypothetical protein